VNDSGTLNRQTGERVDHDPVTDEAHETNVPNELAGVIEPRAAQLADDQRDRAVAFRSLMGGALDDAYRRASVLLGDRFEAEDAVHDAAEKAWRGWRSLRDPARFDAWFGRILVNTCRDRLRSRRRVQQIEVPDDAGREPVAGAAPAGAGEDGRLREALSTLSPDERIVVALRYEADLTVPSIAALVGVPEGTIKSRLHHAHRKLRTALEGRAQ
jgi:RNA polymerase sigma-70 factor, ECF subfamily